MPAHQYLNHWSVHPFRVTSSTHSPHPHPLTVTTPLLYALKLSSVHSPSTEFSSLHLSHGVYLQITALMKAGTSPLRHCQCQSSCWKWHRGSQEQPSIPGQELISQFITTITLSPNLLEWAMSLPLVELMSFFILVVTVSSQAKNVSFNYSIYLRVSFLL